MYYGSVMHAQLIRVVDVTPTVSLSMELPFVASASCYPASRSSRDGGYWHGACAWVCPYSADKPKRANYGSWLAVRTLKEICTRGNNKVVIYISLYHDK